MLPAVSLAITIPHEIVSAYLVHREHIFKGHDGWREIKKHTSFTDCKLQLTVYIWTGEKLQLLLSNLT